MIGVSSQSCQIELRRKWHFIRRPCQGEQSTESERMKIGTIRTLVVFEASFLVSSIASAEKCMQYEPVTVTIQGSVSLKPAYGPPGFGEDPRHDAREDDLALTLDPGSA
jgi:hypothetical protein